MSRPPVLSIIVVFGIRSRQETPRMDRMQRKWNALSFFSLQREIPLQLLQSCRLPIFLRKVTVTAFRSWGMHCERQQSNNKLCK